MELLKSLQGLGQEAWSRLPARWTQVSNSQSVIGALGAAIAFPALVSERGCTFVAGKTVGALSYSSYLVPGFLKNIYHSYAVKRATKVVDHLDPYLREHPNLTSLVLCAAKYQEAPGVLRKVKIYAEAFLHLIGIAVGKVYLQRGNAEKREALAHKVIAPLVTLADREAVKSTLTFSLSFLLQLAVNEMALQKCTQLAPRVYSSLQLTDKTVTALIWAIRGYLYAPSLYRLGHAAWSGYQFHQQAPLPEEKIALLTKELNLPTQFVRPLNEAILNFYKKAFQLT